MFSHSPYGWVSYLHRAATTYYLCCGQALEDSQGAGRIGLTHILVKSFSKNEDTTVPCSAKAEETSKPPIPFPFAVQR